MSIADKHKGDGVEVARLLHRAGYHFYATEGTAALLRALGIPVDQVAKRLADGHPNVLDVINDGLVNAVVNTPEGGRGPVRDGFLIRRAAVERRIPCFTSVDTARAAAQALVDGGAFSVLPLDEYRKPAVPGTAG
jgi:carbamoyl-phosphate synthase large subunit